MQVYCEGARGISVVAETEVLVAGAGPAGHVLLYENPTEGTVVCNMTNAIEIDGTSAESITQGLLTCRSRNAAF